MSNILCKASVVTVSDSRAGGQLDDVSGDLIAERLLGLPATIVYRAIAGDSINGIQSVVRHAIGVSHLVVLTGGTGVGPRDVTPQAIEPLLDYQLPGFAEAMRHHGLQRTAHAMISRQVVGVAEGCLLMALPGSPRAVGDSLDSVWEALPHALALLSGDTEHHAHVPQRDATP